MKSLYIISYLALLAFIFFGIPDRLLYSNGLSEYIPHLLIFFFQSFLLYKILGAFQAPNNKRIFLTSISGFVLMVVFWFYTDKIEEKTLHKYGVETNGIINEKWFASGNMIGWYIRATYTVSGKTYDTPVESNGLNKYNLGDTITVIYNKNFPQQNRIKKMENNN